VGYNCAFGKDREGDIPWLKEAVKKYGIKLKVVNQVKNGGYIVSSQNKRFNKQKQISLANKTSGRIFEINGIHVSGNKNRKNNRLSDNKRKSLQRKNITERDFTCSVFDAYGKCYPPF
jgi:FAD synthase